MTSKPWFAFTPRDTVFVRDGRSFNAADDTAAQAVVPGPSTVAGAVGQALDGEPDEVRGPVLGRRTDSGWEPHFPVPADLVRRRRTVYRLTPAEARGTTDLEDLYPERGRGDCSRWLVPPSGAERADPLRGWLPGAMLARYLKGDLPPDGGTPHDRLRITEAPLLPEQRVGLARDEHRRARTGFLYQAAHLRMDDNWAFLAQCVFAKAAERTPHGPVPLGGRGRLADVAPAASADWPAHPEGHVDSQVLVYLATPALWRTGWRIPLPDDGQLVAAATGEPEPVATVKPGKDWEKTRVLRWAVPAGSVYLVKFPSDERGAQWARDVHGTAWRGPDDEERLRTAGFGVLLTGVWK